jgi:hypothetical protein
MDQETMVGFGPKQAWLAIRDGAVPAAGSPAVERVLAALGLRDLGPVDWRSGLDLAYLTDDRLVLTPGLPGADGDRWLLVVGRWLLLEDPVDLAALSGVLDTEVQSFATYRVGDVHRWARAVSGELVRAFAFRGEAGEVSRWLGDPDAAELAIGLPGGFGVTGIDTDEPEILVSEKDVLRLAGAWSVDPSALDGRPAPGPLRAAAVPS